MSLETQSRDVKRALLKRPQTAAELAARAGYGSGRAISRSLGSLVKAGVAVKTDDRIAKYTKP